MRPTTLFAAVFAISTLTGSAALAQDSAAAAQKPPTKQEWKMLWDGKTLTNWKETDFYKGGKAHIEPAFKGKDAAIVVDAGSSLSGINWTGPVVPKTNYEISLESLKVSGQDFMCGLTFSVGDSFASLILGGWGGFTTGISSLDSMDASENETRSSVEYLMDYWYKVRMRVTDSKIQAFLDDKKIIDVVTTGRKVSLRFGDIKKSTPIGISNYQTTAAYKNIKLRTLTPQEIAETNAKPTK